MAAVPPAETNASDVVIFGRLLSRRGGEMAPDLARYVLTLCFDAPDRSRMEGLAAGNRRGALSPGEGEELMGYVKAGHLLALLHSEARKALKGQASR